MLEIEPEARLRQALAAPEWIWKVLIEERKRRLRAYDVERSGARDGDCRGASAAPSVRRDFPAIRRVGLERIGHEAVRVRWPHLFDLGCPGFSDGDRVLPQQRDGR